MLLVGEAGNRIEQESLKPARIAARLGEHRKIQRIGAGERRTRRLFIGNGGGNRWLGRP
jgi:hypothetical protein